MVPKALRQSVCRVLRSVFDGAVGTSLPPGYGQLAARRREMRSNHMAMPNNCPLWVGDPVYVYILASNQPRADKVVPTGVTASGGLAQYQRRAG